MSPSEPLVDMQIPPLQQALSSLQRYALGGARKTVWEDVCDFLSEQVRKLEISPAGISIEEEIHPLGKCL